MRSLLLIGCIPIALLGCSKGSGSPGGPVEPPPPGTDASIVANGAITFGLCNGPGGGCFYTQSFANTGQGCANNVHGKIRVYEDETLLETDDWWLESSLVMQPGESVLVEDCCFTQDAVRQQTRTVTENFWNNVPCS